MQSNIKRRKQLIEVALPLEAINAVSAREKSIRHGHLSTVHLWWARRPLAAARAFLDSPTHRVHYVWRPFQREPDFGVTSVNYYFAELLMRAEQPA